MYKAYGLKSGKVYVTGSRADCMRKLIDKYPSLREVENRPNTGAKIEQVLPEALKVVRV